MSTRLKQTKFGLISSRGGHLYQLLSLEEIWRDSPHFWVTFPGSDTDFLLDQKQKYYGYQPTTRNIFNAVRNALLALQILYRERPAVLISCGAAIAPPFFWVGKLFGCKLIYIEPFDFITYPTLSGQLIQPIADIFLVQHQKQLRHFKKAQYWGSLL